MKEASAACARQGGWCLCCRCEADSLPRRAAAWRGRAGVRDASASRGHAGLRGTAVDEARTAHGLANGFGADPWMWVRRHPTGFSVRAACGTARLKQPGARTCTAAGG